MSVSSRPSIAFAKEHFKEEINRIAEVGVCGGGHAFIMSETLHPKEFYLIDCYKTILDTEPVFSPEEHSAFYKEAHKYIWNIPNCHFILKKSQEAALYVPDELDLVYIDGAHDELNVLIDIACWFPKIRVGGILCGHDYNSHEDNGVSRAVKRFFNDVQTEEVDWWIIKEKENYD